MFCLMTVIFFIELFKSIQGQIISNYVWSSWSKWPLACSTTCKVGQRCRIRKCQDAHGTTVDIKKCGKLLEGRDCQKCMNKGICPIDAQWSTWKEWSDCKLAGGKCGSGKRTRVRICDNPKQKYDGMSCIGNSSEVETCSIVCDKDINTNSMLNQLINHHFANLKYNILLKSYGDTLTLDCFTEAYAVASLSDKKLYVLWNFNGVPIRSLEEMLLEDIMALQSKFQLPGVTKAFFVKPTGHYKFSGTKLIVESLTVNDSGVYTCMLNYDFVDYANTFYTVIVPNSFRYAHEFDDFIFNSNTEGLENIEYFDSAVIKWFLNRKLMFSGILVEPANRYKLINVNKSFQGYWECHLYANLNNTQPHWLVNRFTMKIKFPRSIWLKLSDNELLKQLGYFLIFAIVMVILVFVTSLVVTKQQLTNRVDLVGKQEIIQEETQNNRLMLIVARNRAKYKTMMLMKLAGDLDSLKDEEDKDNIEEEEDTEETDKEDVHNHDDVDKDN